MKVEKIITGRHDELYIINSDEGERFVLEYRIFDSGSDIVRVCKVGAVSQKGLPIGNASYVTKTHYDLSRKEEESIENKIYSPEQFSRLTNKAAEMIEVSAQAKGSLIVLIEALKPIKFAI